MYYFYYLFDSNLKERKKKTLVYLFNVKACSTYLMNEKFNCKHSLTSPQRNWKTTSAAQVQLVWNVTDLSINSVMTKTLWIQHMTDSLYYWTICVCQFIFVLFCFYFSKHKYNNIHHHVHLNACPIGYCSGVALELITNIAKLCKLSKQMFLY